MELENRIVCFIDILGYKEIIEKFELDNDISIIEKIQKAFRSALNSITSFKNPDYAKKINIEPEKVDLLIKEFYFKTFSDNILIAIKYNEIDLSFYGRLSIMLYFSNIFQYQMLLEGIYMRGGISFGTFYCDENIIFSPALVKAYEIESKKAIFPRIALDSRLALLLSTIEDKWSENFGFNELLFSDGEEMLFLHPFSASDSLGKSLEEILNDVGIPISDHPVLKIINMLPDKERALVLNPWKAILESYKIILEEIKIKAKDLKYNESVRTKYQWLMEFYAWKYEGGNSNYSFRQFRNQIK